MAIGIVSVGLGALAGSAISLAAFAPGLGDIITRFMNGTFQARIPTSAEVSRMRQFGLLDEASYETLMADTGFSQENTRRLWSSFLDSISPQDILTLYFRYRDEPTVDYPATPQWFRERMTAAGVKESVLDEFLEANRPVPSLQDIISFAVRDVFEPEQVEQAGLFNDLPPEYMREAKKRGLSEQDAKYYWGAHWNLPGLVQVYELYHRLYPGSGHATTFTDKDMDIFFNLADIAPGYREWLKEISYNPLTRVDIRRIYGMGIWGRGEQARARLIREYRQLGYDPTNAGILAEFTIQSYGPGRKKYTYSQIKSLYLNNMWGDQSRTKAGQELQTLGYDSEQAALILDYIDLETVDQDEKDKIETIKQQYLNGIIEDEITLHDKLVAVPMTTEEARKFEASFERERQKQQSRLSRSDVDKLYRAGTIDESQYRVYMRRLGYVDHDIDRLIEYYGQERNPRTAQPSKEDVTGWYADGIITALDFVRLMREIGFRDEFIRYYAESSGDPLPDEIIKKLTIPEGLQDYEI